MKSILKILIQLVVLSIWLHTVLRTESHLEGDIQILPHLILIQRTLTKDIEVSILFVTMEDMLLIEVEADLTGHLTNLSVKYVENLVILP